MTPSPISSLPGDFRCDDSGDASKAPDHGQCFDVPLEPVDEPRLTFGTRTLANHDEERRAEVAYVVRVLSANVALNLFVRRLHGVPSRHVWGARLALAIAAMWNAAVEYLRSGNVREGAERAARRIGTWPRDGAPTAFAAVPEGRAWIAGRVCAGSCALGSSDVRFVAATRLRVEGPRAPALASRATAFVLEEQRTGERAAVHAAHVVIVGGREVGDEAVVPDGAAVEIVATARRTRVVDARHGYRDAAHQLELSGDAASPVMIRVLDPSPARH